MQILKAVSGCHNRMKKILCNYFIPDRWTRVRPNCVCGKKHVEKNRIYKTYQREEFLIFSSLINNSEPLYITTPGHPSLRHLVFPSGLATDQTRRCLTSEIVQGSVFQCDVAVNPRRRMASPVATSAVEISMTIIQFQLRFLYQSFMLQFRRGMKSIFENTTKC